MRQFLLFLELYYRLWSMRRNLRQQKQRIGEFEVRLSAFRMKVALMQPEKQEHYRKVVTTLEAWEVEMRRRYQLQEMTVIQYEAILATL